MRGSQGTLFALIVALGALSATSDNGKTGKLSQRKSDMLDKVYHRVMAHVVDCGASGLEGPAAADCVKQKLHDARMKTRQNLPAAEDPESSDKEKEEAEREFLEKQRKEIVHKAGLKHKEKQAKLEVATRRAQRRFKRRHPSAEARMERQEEREERQAEESQPTPQPAPPTPFVYRPFVDEPQFQPRFAPDLIHRNVMDRAKRYVPRTGYKPRDALEKTHIDWDDLHPKPSPFPKSIEIAASMNKMKEEIDREEKNIEDRHDRYRNKMEYMFDREMTKLAGKEPPELELSSGEHKIINAQVKSVLDHVNPIADKAIEGVMRLDKQPQPHGGVRKITVTANTIARMVTRKVANATTEAIKMIKHARNEAHLYKDGAAAVEAATREAKRIVAKAKEEAELIAAGSGYGSRSGSASGSASESDDQDGYGDGSGNHAWPSHSASGDGYGSGNGYGSGHDFDGQDGVKHPYPRAEELIHKFVHDPQHLGGRELSTRSLGPSVPPEPDYVDISSSSHDVTDDLRQLSSLL